MLTIGLDAIAAYLLHKYFSSWRQYIVFGLIAGIIVSAIGSALVGAVLSVPVVYVVFSGLSSIVPHTLIIYFFLWLGLREAQKKRALQAMKEKERYWDENEQRIIKEVLDSNKHIDFLQEPRNEELEFNLSRVETEELIGKIKKKHLACHAIPTALRILNSRIQREPGQ